ncbi:hypothetical protein CMV_025633 [Castanea mollissima]|uniref:Uncharacterized protein n=1 Tax=Castanea mollissima TaxID=60419 RepID=A0A8J4VB92_9ROSI|nr:hypothetical protein CMV_025633 [Castanea mollissima]
MRRRVSVINTYGTSRIQLWILLPLTEPRSPQRLLQRLRRNPRKWRKGFGVDKNYTKAKEYFEKAANNEDAGGHYNLGVMYLKGIGVKKDVKIACKYFILAANAGQPKAFYQLAKMFHTGVGLKKSLQMVYSD